MLFNKNTDGQYLSCILVINRNDMLDNNEPAVERLINKVYGATSPLDAVLQSLALRV